MTEYDKNIVWCPRENIGYKDITEYRYKMANNDIIITFKNGEKEYRYTLIAHVFKCVSINYKLLKKEDLSTINNYDQFVDFICRILYIYPIKKNSIENIYEEVKREIKGRNINVSFSNFNIKDDLKKYMESNRIVFDSVSIEKNTRRYLYLTDEDILININNFYMYIDNMYSHHEIRYESESKKYIFYDIDYSSGKKFERRYDYTIRALGMINFYGVTFNNAMRNWGFVQDKQEDSDYIIDEWTEKVSIDFKSKAISIEKNFETGEDKFTLYSLLNKRVYNGVRVDVINKDSNLHVGDKLNIKVEDGRIKHDLFEEESIYQRSINVYDEKDNLIGYMENEVAFCMATVLKHCRIEDILIKSIDLDNEEPCIYISFIIESKELDGFFKEKYIREEIPSDLYDKLKLEINKNKKGNGIEVEKGYLPKDHNELKVNDKVFLKLSNFKGNLYDYIRKNKFKIEVYNEKGNYIGYVDRSIEESLFVLIFKYNAIKNVYIKSIDEKLYIDFDVL